LGVALIIGAWNYPIMLTLGPLVGAIAGGNAAVIKPSELVPNSAAVIERLVRQYLDPDAFAVVQGGVPETTELLGCRFDKILFTGSPAVGKIVMKAAAVNLTPVVLELGGKSPAIICQDANLEVAATRVTWGKFFNAGQTCIGVDYALVHESVYEEFIDLVRGRIRRFYGDDPHASPDYPRIVNEPNLQRLCSLLEGQSIVVGGQSIAAERYLAPTVLRDVDPQSSIMQEEIFGPILPMLPFTDVDEVIGRVNAGEKPLAMYIFSQDKLTVRRILSAVSSGGACINDVLVHITAAAPFGGVGNSGMGSYHGRDGYDAFTHRRTVVTSGTAFDPSVRYPPYSRFKNKVSKYLV
jgi:aldehyde dehydrogenase (NAD+)